MRRSALQPYSVVVLRSPGGATQMILGDRNAITYTPPGGIVSLSLIRADATHVAITVADTGIGIPPDEVGRVFDRFYRTDASRARVSGGFGLGLSIARDLVQAVETVLAGGTFFPGQNTEPN